MFREEDRQIVYAVLRHIQEKGFMKNADVREISGRSAATAKRLLAKMTSAQLISLEGTGRWQKYVKWVK